MCRTFRQKATYERRAVDPQKGEVAALAFRVCMIYIFSGSYDITTFARTEIVSIYVATFVMLSVNSPSHSSFLSIKNTFNSFHSIFSII